MGSLITLNASVDYSGSGTPQPDYATYSWNFGDGTPAVAGYAPGSPACELPWLTPCAASVLHSYQYGGTYEVTLTVTDVAGNKASVTHQVTVVGPPAPGTPGSATGSGSGSSSAGLRRQLDVRLRGRLGGLRHAADAGRRRRGHLHEPAIPREQGPAHPLLGQRAGRGSLRGPDQPDAREAPRNLRSRRGRTARRHPAPGRDRQSGRRDDGRGGTAPSSCCSPSGPRRAWRVSTRWPSCCG